MAEEKINKFVINYLTEEQYAAALEAGTLNNNDFYCTSDITEGEEVQDTGAGAVFISNKETDEEIYDKIQSSMEFYDETGSVRATKNLILAYFETANDMSFSTPTYAHLTSVESNTLDNIYAYFYANVSGYEFYFTIHAYLSNGVKTIEIRKTIKHLMIVDELISDSTKNPLSANQGRILNEKIEALEARIAALESGEVNMVAVDPTDTTDMNLWIETS